MSWVNLPELTTDAEFTAVLTAEHLNRLRTNQEYLYSLEAFGAPVFRLGSYTAGNAESTAWAGYLYHWLRTFRWQIKVISVDTSQGAGTYYFKIQIDWGDHTFATSTADIMQSSAVVAGTVYNSTGDLTVSPAYDGLYAPGKGKGTVCKVRVQARNCAVEIQYLHTQDTLPAGRGGYDWLTLPALADGTVLSVAQWNVYRNNLLYLRDQLAGALAPTEEDQDLGVIDPEVPAPWRGFFQHRSDSLAYRIGGWPASDTNTWSYPVTPAVVVAGTRYPIGQNRSDLAIGDYYSGEVYTDGADRGNWPPPHKVEDRVEYLPDSAARATNPMPALTKGTWYEFQVYRRGTSADIQGGNVQPISLALNHAFEVRGVPNPTGWNAIAPFTHGEYPDGSMTSKLQKLGDNLTLLKSRINGYPSLLCSAPTGQGDRYHYRRGDVLVWSGSGVVLEYIQTPIPVGFGVTRQRVELGSNTGAAYLDLRALTDLPYGAYYVVIGATYTFEVIE